MTYSRPLCRTEKVYLVLDEKRPGFANQFILEGTGVLDREKWQKAVEIASEANPGSRLVLKGHWAFSRWVDSGITPRVREMDSNGWDGSGPEGGPAFLNESLPARDPAVICCTAIPTGSFSGRTMRLWTGAAPCIGLRISSVR